MALLNNYSNVLRSPGRYLSGDRGICGTGSFNNSSLMRNQDSGLSKNYGAPTGYNGSYAYYQPRTQGGMASINRSSASGSISSDINLGLQIASSFSASGVISSADLAVIVGLIASLTASGTVTDADMSIVSNIVASISASGTVTDATISIALGLVADLSASGVISDNNLTTLLGMFVDISSVTELSPQALSAELLDNQDIETGYSLREALRLILSAVGGKVSGADTTTITFRNVGDTKDRIVATVDSNGNRSALTYDVS